jgi:hypothetical protein
MIARLGELAKAAFIIAMMKAAFGFRMLVSSG